jgi:uncharacterized protein YcbK (DUF882 family)
MGGVSLSAKWAAIVMAAAASATVAAPSACPVSTAHGGAGLASKKGPADDAPDAPPALATLVQTHTDENVVLDAAGPARERFDALLADRVTGAHQALDARLIDLLRALASSHPGARIELVSGFRSPKLNEMLRKKGHHVASHSQHSLGHAVDFRVVPEGEDVALDPRDVEREVRALGWDGGVGVYPTRADWFVHCDVGPRREWVN